MKIFESYIVKENDFSAYQMKTTMGTGFNALEKPEPLNDGYIDPEFSFDQANHFVLKVNDKKLDNLVDFIVRGDTIIFSNPLEEGDKITIEDSILDNVKIVTKNSYSRNAVFKIFSSLQKFKKNHTYNWSVNIKGVKYESKFATSFDPYYTTIKKIRLDTGTLLESVSDEIIAGFIYQNSKEAYEIIGDVDEIQPYVRNYVRYKTDIDLCYAIYLSISGKYGSQSKSIGNVEISKTIKLPYIDNMIARFKELLKPNEDLLNGDSNSVLSFVKAGDTQYPVSGRGVF